MDIYVTKQGETVDLACFKFYGRTAGVVEMVLAANPGLADKGLVPPMGTSIIMPPKPAVALAPLLVSLWD